MAIASRTRGLTLEGPGPINMRGCISALLTIFRRSYFKTEKAQGFASRFPRRGKNTMRQCNLKNQHLIFLKLPEF